MSQAAVRCAAAFAASAIRACQGKNGNKKGIKKGKEGNGAH